MIFGMEMYYNKMAYRASLRPSCDLDLRSQGQIIDFLEHFCIRAVTFFYLLI